VQVVVLWTAQNNFFDDVPVDKVKDFQAKLTDFFHTRKAGAAGENPQGKSHQRRHRGGVEGGGHGIQADLPLIFMPSTRDIRRRIKSVKNTAQITKAMQMVAAAKMRKAQQAALVGRPYAELMNEMLAEAATRTVGLIIR
jgi:hypothetical protein